MIVISSVQYKTDHISLNTVKNHVYEPSFPTKCEVTLTCYDTEMSFATNNTNDVLLNELLKDKFGFGLDEMKKSLS